MSKIKDLLAEEEGIEDLMPTKAMAKYRLLDDMRHVISDNAKDIRSELSEKAEFDVDCDDEGRQTPIIKNYDSMLDSIAEGYLEDYVFQQQVDVHDDEYDWVLKHLKEEVALSFEDYYDEIIKEAGRE